MSQREAINAALQSALSTITLANGYALDVDQVSRKFSTLDDIDDWAMPVLFVEDDGKDSILYQSGLHVISFPISIIGVVKLVSGELISTTINTLDAALIKAVGADPTLGDTCTEALPGGLSYRSGSRGVEYGVFIRPINIRYKNTLANGL